VSGRHRKVSAEPGEQSIELRFPLGPVFVLDGDYDYRPDGFTLHNLAASARSFQLDLTALYPQAQRLTVRYDSGTEATLDATPVELGAGSRLTVSPDFRQ